MRQLRVLVFTDPNLSSIVRELSSFASVKQVNWKYRPIPNGLLYTRLKIPYRTMEGLYWVLRVFREIYRFKADVVIAQFAYFCGLIGAIAAKLSKRRFVLRAVGSDLKVYSRSFIGAMLVRLTLRIASGAICVSRDLEKIARRLGAKSTIVVPSSIASSYFSETNLRKTHREIISIARLVPVKGLDYLVRAMTHIRDGTLVIIGDGPERGKLESLALSLKLGDRVVFAGWIDDRSRLRSLLNQATVFVMPSISEGLPRAIVEAMACGLPIVATNVGGVPEIVTDGTNGFLVPPQNEKALAEAIEKVLNDIEFQKSASAKNKEVAKKHLSTNAAQRIHDYLEEIVVHQLCSARL